MDQFFSKVAVIGVGLIGGSLGLALKRSNPMIHIRGVGRDSKRLETARVMGAIDEFSTVLGPDLADRDLVILATPIENILDTLDSIGPFLSPGAVVTDVGSTKRQICLKAWRNLPPFAEFVGGHPIAGREIGGFENALVGLFKGAPYVLCPDPGKSDHNIQRLKSLCAGLGSRVYVLSPDEHDTSLAWLSHLPQLLSTVLATSAEARPTELSGSGFRDMTRLAGSPYSVWDGIMRTNSDNIDGALCEFIRRIEQIREDLKQGRLAGEFERAGRVYDRTRRAGPGKPTE